MLHLWCMRYPSAMLPGIAHSATCYGINFFGHAFPAVFCLGPYACTRWTTELSNCIGLLATLGYCIELLSTTFCCCVGLRRWTTTMRYYLGFFFLCYYAYLFYKSPSIDLAIAVFPSGVSCTFCQFFTML